jgi:hemerythrin
MNEIPAWTESLCVGDSIQDMLRQHVFTVGQRVQHLRDEGQQDVQSAHEVLNDVVEAMRECFIAEEDKLMTNACRYKELHMNEHKNYMERLMSLILKIPQNGIDLEELMSVMRDWATKHAPVIDTLCKKCGYVIYHTPTQIETVCVHRNKLS